MRAQVRPSLLLDRWLRGRAEPLLVLDVHLLPDMGLLVELPHRFDWLRLAVGGVAERREDARTCQQCLDVLYNLYHDFHLADRWAHFLPQLPFSDEPDHLGAHQTGRNYLPQALPAIHPSILHNDACQYPHGLLSRR
jgi:hypothetical protein